MSRKSVWILTENYRIRGEIEIAPEERVTDFITSAKNFVAVTDAEVRDQEGSLVFTAEFLNVHRDHIVVVSPVALTSRS